MKIFSVISVVINDCSRLFVFCKKKTIYDFKNKISVYGVEITHYNNMISNWSGLKFKSIAHVSVLYEKYATTACQGV